MSLRWNHSRENQGSLKRKMFFGMLLILIPVLILVTVLFMQTRSVMKEEYIRTVYYNLREIIRNVDEKLEEVIYISDTYAENEELNDYVQKDYSVLSDDKKKSDIMRIHREIFDVADRMNRREKMSAVYTRKGQLLNFLDPNNDTKEVREKLEELGVYAPDTLMRFVWYPVRENFLKGDLPENIHERMAVFVSRKVFSWSTKQYEYVQIFTLDEKDIYDQYKEIVDSVQGDIYIVDGQGALISTSDEECLRDGKLPNQLGQVLETNTEKSFELNEHGKKQLVSVEESSVNDWRIVMIAPVSQVTREMDVLYFQFTVILLICMGISGLLIMWLYKSFMEPLGKLSISMHEVYGGNLKAYVEKKDKKRKNEADEMIVYYNSMLRQINTHVIRELEADRQKKELELEVLMSQINPHFLYNTLENIIWKANEAGRPDIGRIAASLGRMYRLSISGGHVIVPMEHEIEHLMTYVKIQLNRYSGAAEFDLRTDMQQIHELYSLKILLQPLVENSFLYGMEGVERPFKIRLSIRKKDGWVSIRVADNGCGMDPERLEQVRDQIKRGRRDTSPSDKNRRSTGIGLHSVQKRILLYFGLEDAVTIYSKKGQGTLVIVKIPEITGSDVDEDGNLKEDRKAQK